MILEAIDKVGLIEQLKVVSSTYKIYIMCAGEYGQIVGEYLDLQHVAWECYLDNNKDLENIQLNNKNVIRPEHAIDKEHAIVIICHTFCYPEICEQLCSLGFLEANIWGFKNRFVLDQIIYDMRNPQKYLDKLSLLKNYGKEKKRCFVIGGGPSITLGDLEKLQYEDTLATNSIINCFSLINWRPTFYFIQDMISARMIKKEDKLRWLTKECQYILCSVKNCLYEYRDCGIENLYFYYIYDNSYENIPEFSDDITKKLYYASTTVYSMLQVAAYMGYKEIYLLGMDLGFVNEKHLDGTIIRGGAFNNEAEFMKQKDGFVGIYEIDRILLGYQATKKYCGSHGIKVYNATRGGKLEVFERVDFDSLF